MDGMVRASTACCKHPHLWHLDASMASRSCLWMIWNAEACRSDVVTHISPKRFSGLTVRLYRTLIDSRTLSQLHPDRMGIILPVPTRVGMAPECLCMPGLLP